MAHKKPRGAIRNTRAQRHPNSRLAALDAPFDSLFESMQSTKARDGAAAAFKASPEDLSNLALAAAQRAADTMTLWEVKLDMLGPFASLALLRKVLQAAPLPGPTVDYLSGYLAGLEVGTKEP